MTVREATWAEQGQAGGAEMWDQGKGESASPGQQPMSRWRHRLFWRARLFARGGIRIRA